MLSTNFIYAPEGLANELILRMVIDNTYNILDSGIYTIDCGERDRYEDIFLLVDGKWLQFRARDYIIEHAAGCIIGIVPLKQESWVFGTSLFQGYYTVFDNRDHNDAAIGFAPAHLSDKYSVTSGSPPKAYVKEYLWELTWPFILKNYLKERWDVDATWLCMQLGNWWFSTFGV